MIVEDVQITHLQSSLRVVEIDLYGVVPHGNHPEDVVPVNSHVVIMDLLSYGQGVRSNWNRVEVQSNKTEGTVMLLTVRTDESALTEAHVGPERQFRNSTSHGVGSRSAALDVRQSDETVEVRDL